MCFPVLALLTLSSSTLWSEFLEEKLCSKQSVGYLRDLKFAFAAISTTQGQFLIAGKKFDRDRVANLL